MAGLDKIKLPLALRERNPYFIAGMYLHAFGLFAIGGWLAVQAWYSDFPLVIRVLLMLPCWFFSQQGLHALAWIGHEALHFSLHPNRYISYLMGMIPTSFIIGFSMTGHSLSHWNHHRYTNQMGDPDRILFGRYQTLFARVFLSRLHANQVYRQIHALVLAGKPLPDYAKFIPFSHEILLRFAKVNLVVLALTHTALIVALIVAPMPTIVGVIIPQLFLTIFSGLRNYQEHAGTGMGMFYNTRTRIHWFETFMYFGNNYHLEHHLYPTVPCYQLPAVHRFLVEQGCIKQDMSVSKGYFDSFRFCLTRYDYPVVDPTQVAHRRHEDDEPM